MTFYSFELQTSMTAVQNTRGEIEETVRISIENNALFVLQYCRIDALRYWTANASGKTDGCLIVQYFNGDPPITSIADVNFASLTVATNGLRFIIDQFKDFNFIDGLYLRGGNLLEFGPTWFGAPVGVAINFSCSITLGFDMKGKANGKLINPEVVYNRELKEVTISGKNPTREVPTA
jgi:hypothetical protein